MSVRLVYHTVASAAGEVSPFATSLDSLVAEGDVRIACPYLTLDYLRHLLATASGWQLLTDAEAWLKSASGDTRQEIVAWLREHASQVKHCSHLHAKVVISASRALIGSANFTHSGLTRNHEMAVELDGEEVRELGAWFESLWAAATPPDGEELNRLSVALPAANSVCPIHLSSSVPPIRAALVTGTDEGAVAASITEQQLAERFACAPSREWIDGFLELAREMVEFAGLSADDPRLAMTFRQEPFLPITINHRYVLTAWRPVPRSHETSELRAPGQANVELILPGRCLADLPTMEGKFYDTSFAPWAKGETHANAPLFVSFMRGAPIRFDRSIRDAWREAVLSECEHGQRSAFRRFHQPLLYRAVTDIDYRKRILDMAFPGS